MVEMSFFDKVKYLDLIIDCLPDAIFAIDLQGNVIAWNKQMEKLTGCKRDTVIGKGDHLYSIPFYGKKTKILIDLVFEPDPELERRYDYFERLNENVLTCHIYLEKIGKTLWAKATPLKDENNEIIGAIESIRDISENTILLKKLSLSDEKFQNLYNITQLFLDSINDMVWAKDIDNRFIFANKSFEKFLKKKSIDLIGRKSFDIYGQGKKFEEADEIAKTKPHHIIESINIDGEEKWLDICKAPLLDRKGMLLGTIGTARDITREVELVKQRNIEIDNLKKIIEEKVKDWRKENEEIHRDISKKVYESIMLLRGIQNDAKQNNIEELNKEEIFF